ncbi:cilia- and flagella-associated protein 77 [Lampris incognitus]|uniref:cilia- and flagella-associated protein 77 n=1 Tax=Lampris incognitus TaxID=2546036 RepID=UPI0024B50A44|nr:cilia- and flagella-associated protein 77 [Lampris incognitus]
MTSPGVGVVRDPTLTNPRPVRASLGESRSHGMPCPSPNFVYGTRTTVRDGGVAEALSSWRIQSACRHGGVGSSQPLKTDFVSLNRDGVKAGLVTSKEVSQYRAQRTRSNQNQNQNHRNQDRASSTRQSNHGPGDKDETFGIRTSSSPPLSELLAHQYGRQWLEEQQTRNQNQQNFRKLAMVPHTRTSLLRRSKAFPQSGPLFKLSRYTQL